MSVITKRLEIVMFIGIGQCSRARQPTAVWITFGLFESQLRLLPYAPLNEESVHAIFVKPAKNLVRLAINQPLKHFGEGAFEVNR